MNRSTFLGAAALAAVLTLAADRASAAPPYGARPPGVPHAGYYGGYRGFYGGFHGGPYYGRGFYAGYYGRPYYGFYRPYPWWGVRVGVYPGYYGFYRPYPWVYGAYSSPLYVVPGGYPYLPNDYPYDVSAGYAGAPGDDTASAIPPADVDRAMIGVFVPEGADVWFDGRKTTQTGTARQFLSPPLAPGMERTYRVRARWVQGSRVLDRTRTVRVQAGDRFAIDFTTPERPAPAAGETLPPPE